MTSLRLALVQAGTRTVLAALRGEQYVDVAALGFASDLGTFLGEQHDWAPVAAAVADAPPSAVVANPCLLPPIAVGARIICLGLNYVDHASEAKYDKPAHPVIFSRFAQSFVGHDAAIVLPKVSERFDYEAELVAVIGRGGRHISVDNALDHVAGYTLMNDGSVRDWQVRTHQWTLGKNFDASGSIGPVIVDAKALPAGGRDLRLRGLLNDKVMQEASTSDMIFDVATTISTLSQAMALAPGDLIAMGTPSGVGNARSPQVFMVEGDRFDVDLEGVMRLSNVVARER